MRTRSRGVITLLGPRRRLEWDSVRPKSVFRASRRLNGPAEPALTGLQAALTPRERVLSGWSWRLPGVDLNRDV